MNGALHHYHLRKRVCKMGEQLPSPDKWKRFLDEAIYVVGILGPVMTLPQVFKVWFEHNASGLAPVSWGSYILFNIFWLAYGITHKEKPIIITYTLWILINTFVFIGILLFG
ncbi:MAG: hypothetical protein UT33_C0005G0022 [Candidatus Peregrinibacteria bacterium GW2011_GWC2_39_14]|nr:MAG: hypothetical protein US92_C0001G0022 [Candidatus Peregrinibacteria bacterium GW2011_GWA2_38_36]KKR07078.1 MAG: hypothetical protein UT33_C0005G0022 [Candidatus Peregrinibacteria bacterium GW2011_GWC2_39_14]